MKPVKKIFNYLISVLTLFSIELLLSWIIFLGSMIIFLSIAEKIFISKEEQFDLHVFEWIDTITTHSLTQFMKHITFFASKEFIFGVSLLIFVYFMFIKKHHWYSLKVPVVCLGSITLNLVLKNFFERPRPFFPHLVKAYGMSFPSGHAMISFSFYGLLIYLTWKDIENRTIRFFIASLLFVLMHLIGFSRVYLKVHFASDVLAGFAIGSVWLIISIFILKKIEAFSANRIHIEESF